MVGMRILTWAHRIHENSPACCAATIPLAQLMALHTRAHLYSAKPSSPPRPTRIRGGRRNTQCCPGRGRRPRNAAQRHARRNQSPPRKQTHLLATHPVTGNRRRSTLVVVIVNPRAAAKHPLPDSARVWAGWVWLARWARTRMPQARGQVAGFAHWCARCGRVSFHELHRAFANTPLKCVCPCSPAHAAHQRIRNAAAM